MRIQMEKVDRSERNSFCNYRLIERLCALLLRNLPFAKEQCVNSPRLLLMALLSLTLGVLVYITARAPGTTLFLPPGWSLAIPWPSAVMAIMGSLPTFFHTIGFCLLLVWLAGTGDRRALWICAGVFFMEAAFEIGQHTLTSHWLVDHLPQWFNHTWLLAHTGPSLLAGVFDPFDLIAAAAGAFVALLLVAAFTPERGHGYV